MTFPDGARHRHLVAAAVLAGAAGLVLTAIGWWVIDWQYRSDWERLGDAGWWSSEALRLLGFLAFGKLGFKVALAAVAVGAGAVVGLRHRRRVGATGPDGVDATPTRGVT